MDIKKLERRLKRLKEMRDKLLSDHLGNELCYSYWGGYELGYIKGKISIIEDIIDDLELSNNIKSLTEGEYKNTQEKILSNITKDQILSPPSALPKSNEN